MKTKQKTTKNKTSSNRDEMTQPTQRCRVPGVPSTFGREQGNTANKEHHSGTFTAMGEKSFLLVLKATDTHWIFSPARCKLVGCVLLGIYDRVSLPLRSFHAK